MGRIKKWVSIAGLILISTLVSIFFFNAKYPDVTGNQGQVLPTFLPTALSTGSRGQTWDGRVFSFVTGSPKSIYFTVFRPEFFSETLNPQNDSTPNFNSGYIFGSSGQKSNYLDAITDLTSIINYGSGLRAGMSNSTPAPFSSYYTTLTFAAGYPDGESGLSSHAIAPDPDYQENPVRMGTTDTYYLLVYSTSLSTQSDCIDPKGSSFGLGAMKIVITVENARKLNARVKSAVVTSNWQRLRLKTPITVTNNGNTISSDGVCGRHPSVTNDGRLLVFEDTTYISYIWNGNSTLKDGNYIANWSRPADITKMYYVDRDRDVGGIKFSDRYPVAKKPMKDSLGRPYRDENGNPLWWDGTKIDDTSSDSQKLKIANLDRHIYTGGYPWITPDGTDIMNASIGAWQPSSEDVLDSSKDNDGAIRAAEVIVGQNTNFSVRHIDSSINQNRGGLNLLRTVRNSLSSQYLSSVNKSSLADLTETERSYLRGRVNIAVNTYSRLIPSSLGPALSMWGPYKEVPNFKLPYLPGRNVLPVIMSSGMYDEINFDDTTDGNYLLYLHLQENLQRAIGIGKRSVIEPFQVFSSLSDALSYYSTNPTDLRPRYQTQYDPSVTPDSSGNEKNDGSLSYGVLEGGAKFPQEYNNRDETVGAVGQAIYFPESGSVRVKNDAQLNNIGKNITIQFFFKRLANLAGLDQTGNPYRLLLKKAGVFDVILEKNGGIQASFNTKNADGTITRTRSGIINTPAANTQDCLGNCHPSKVPWTHVAIRFSGVLGRMDIFINGKLALENKPTPLGVLNTGTTNLVIGPNHPGPYLLDQTQAFVLLDEISISNVFRPISDITQTAFVKRALQSSASLPSGITLPLGLKAQDLGPTPYHQITPEKIKLGEILFKDPRFSKNGLVSCQTCHKTELSFTDGLVKAVGVKQGKRNSPTIINRFFGTLQFFDGRASSVESQSLLPILDGNEHGLSSEADILKKLNNSTLPPNSSAPYSVLFSQAKMKTDNVEYMRQALGAFVRTRFAANSRVDQFENGDSTKLSEAEKQGRIIFRTKGRCISCHSGSNYSDESFHNTGMATNTYVGNNYSTSDVGRYAITGLARDLGQFKTPTLRDISKTAPYLHDGSVGSLEEIIELYNQGVTGVPNLDSEIKPLGLTQEEKDDLAAFLRALDSQP